VSRRAFALCMLLAGPALAGERVDPQAQKKADVLFDKGQGLYQAGQFQAAIPLFQEAYDLVHDPVYLFNIAQSYRKVLDCEHASDFYAQYLAAATDADAKQRIKVEGWIRELAPCVEQRKNDRDAVKRAEANERARKAEELQRKQRVEKPATRRVDRGRALRIAGLVAGGAGVVGLGVGTAFALRGRSLRDQLDEACAVTCDWSDPALREKDRDGQRANTFAAIGWIGGGALVLAGAGLYLWGKTKTETITVSPSVTGVTVSARLAF